MNFSAASAALNRWVTEREQRRALAEFTCAHCERNAQCGRAPGDDCIEKLAQIARGDEWRYRPSAHRDGRRLIA